MADETLRSEAVEAWRRHNPAVDIETMEVVAMVKAVAEQLNRAAERVYASAVVTTADMELLVPLRYDDGNTMTAIKLAERLSMSRAGVSKTLSRLEKRGIVERQPHPTDRRAALIRLTDHGRGVVDELFPRELRAHTELLADGDASEAVRVLRQLLSHKIFQQ